MNPCAYPTSGPIDTVEDLQSWSPETDPDPFNLGFVPLKPRPTAVDGALPAGVKLMDCMDLYNGYVTNGDLYPQGVANFDVYTLSYWQYIDILVYFGHYFFMLPTPWWMNVCHRNGVPVLGTLNGNGQLSEIELLVNGPAGQPTVMSPDGTQVPYFVDKLLRLAAYYGFDGWFFNMEIGMSQALAEEVCAFVASLTENLQQYGLAYGQIHWYDSVTIQGDLSYQNCLDDCNLPFLKACNGLFPNYWWPGGAFCENRSVKASPATSAANATAAGLSPTLVYTGIQPFEGNPAPAGQGGQFNTWISVQACFTAGTSAALFAPDWTYQTATSYSDYMARDQQFWVGTGGTCQQSGMTGGIGATMPARPCPAGLPFVTSFNMGNGDGMYVQGTQVSTAGWGQLGQQDLMPTWRFCFTGGGASSFSAAFDYSTAFTGGSSLAVTAADAGASATLQLFQVSLDVDGDVWVDYTVQGTGVPVTLVLTLEDESTVELCAAGGTGTQPTQVQAYGAWEQRIYQLTPGQLSGSIVQIGLSLGESASAGATVQLGQVRILPISQPVEPGPVTGLAAAGTGWCTCNASATVLSTTLSWTAPAGDLSWYDVYVTGADGGTGAVWLGRAYAQVYFATTPVSGGVTSVSFTVVPVSTYLFAEDPASAAAVPVSVPAQ
jgi:endo-beta-N-acetylglucosaminidase D